MLSFSKHRSGIQDVLSSLANGACLAMCYLRWASCKTNRELSEFEIFNIIYQAYEIGIVSKDGYVNDPERLILFGLDLHCKVYKCAGCEPDLPTITFMESPLGRHAVIGHYESGQFVIDYDPWTDSYAAKVGKVIDFRQVELI